MLGARADEGKAEGKVWESFALPLVAFQFMLSRGVGTPSKVNSSRLIASRSARKVGTWSECLTIFSRVKIRFISRFISGGVAHNETEKFALMDVKVVWNLKREFSDPCNERVLTFRNASQLLMTIISLSSASGFVLEKVTR